MACGSFGWQEVEVAYELLERHVPAAQTRPPSQGRTGLTSASRSYDILQCCCRPLLAASDLDCFLVLIDKVHVKNTPESAR